MFQFLFKYPLPVFTKGHLVLLGGWSGWVLLVLIVGSAAALGILIRWRLSKAVPKLRTWRAGVIWLLQSLLIAMVLTLLWQPAIRVAELASQQNIIAVLIDDSRSMAIADAGGGASTREAAAIKTLQDGVLTGLQRRFHTRIYRLDSKVTRVSTLDEIKPGAAATHISSALKQFVAETSDLPIGAIVLLSDGAENSGGIGGSGGIDVDAIHALGNRRVPVHTIGFGKEQTAHDVEMSDVSVASSAVANSRMAATVSFHQRGYTGSKGVLLVRDGGKALASREVTFGAESVVQSETLFFNAGAAGAKNFQFSIGPLAGEENMLNNATERPVSVSGERRRILYVEGEPRWEYKFIRRAEDDDPTVQIVSMLRTTENKIYRQGINDPKELEGGFPVGPEDLFGYQGIIIGSVEAGYFTPSQQELLREFVDRRGGGLLFLGGRYSLADGGWGGSGLVELMPTFLPNGRNTFHRDPAVAQLTTAGADSPITRLVDDPGKNVERWRKLTYLMDYQDPGTPKPGATVLAEAMNAGRRSMPLLITQSYGHGRTAVMATSGTWRWQMSQPLGDTAHDLFWQQLLRWLVADSPGRVVGSTPARTLTDEGHIQMKATVQDKEYMPAADAQVTAHFIGPDGISAVAEMLPVQDNPGTFQADWTAEKAGSYLAEITAQRKAGEARRSAGEPRGETEGLGGDVVTFQRTDGVAENFQTEQNRELLENLSSQTGGRYWRQQELAKLPTEISYSEAGISVRDTKELWNMPVVFLLLLTLLGSEWMLRRKWGVV